MNESGEWFESEDFWETWYPFMFREERFEAGPAEVENILELTTFQGQEVLDLACGPGRHAVELAKRGLQVTAVDRTAFLLEKARKRATDAGVDIEFVEADMRDFVRPDAYDLVINMFTAFGYFDDKEEDVGVLRNVRSSLRAGGALVMDVVGKEWLAQHFEPTQSTELDDGTLIVRTHEVFDGWSRLRNEWFLIRGDEIKRFRFHHTVYSGQELKSKLLEAGFEQVDLFGDLRGGEYGTEAERLVAVARR